MSAHAADTPAIHGLMAEFDDAEQLKSCARAVKAAGYEAVEAYTPMPVHGLGDILKHKNEMGWVVLGGAFVGALAGFGLCYWVSVLEYPLNIGGKPFNSWPAFMIPTFECAILFASFAAVFGMIALNGLPQPYHPTFNVPQFVRGASRDRFFLVVEARDERFDAQETRRLLAGHEPLSLEEVPL